MYALLTKKISLQKFINLINQKGRELQSRFINKTHSCVLWEKLLSDVNSLNHCNCFFLLFDVETRLHFLDDK